MAALLDFVPIVRLEECAKKFKIHVCPKTNCLQRNKHFQAGNQPPPNTPLRAPFFQQLYAAPGRKMIAFRFRNAHFSKRWVWRRTDMNIIFSVMDLQHWTRKSRHRDATCHSNFWGRLAPENSGTRFRYQCQPKVAESVRYNQLSFTGQWQDMQRTSRPQPWLTLFFLTTGEGKRQQPRTMFLIQMDDASPSCLRFLEFA